MAVPKDFKFSDFPAVQAEAERRVVVMFGEDWRAACSVTDINREHRAILAAENLQSHRQNNGNLFYAKAL